jgi:hypothetical protein
VKKEKGYTKEEHLSDKKFQIWTGATQTFKDRGWYEELCELAFITNKPHRGYESAKKHRNKRSGGGDQWAKDVIMQKEDPEGWEKEVRRRWYQKNRKTVIKKSKKWAKENADKVKAYKKKYYERNKEKVKERSKKWKKENPEKAKASQKKLRDTKKNKEYQKQWRKENPDKVKASQDRYKKKKK